MAYTGTLVAYGQARGVVVATGEQTEIGRISRLLEQVEEVSTPLLRQMRRFGRTLTLFILGVSAGVFLFGLLLRGYGVADMFMAVVGLAVAAIPEGLPAIMTITLAIGVQRMARRRAIVRRLPAVEALGSVTVICTDKTGTLTRNEMTVRVVLAAGGCRRGERGRLRAAWGVPSRRRAGPTWRRCRGCRQLPAPGCCATTPWCGAVQTSGCWRATRPKARYIPSALKAGLLAARGDGGASTHRCHPVRIRASVHGDPAS